MLETLKNRWPKAPEDIHMGSALGRRQRGQANNVVWFASLAWQRSEHEDLHSLAFSLISVFKHSSRAAITSSSAGHTGPACLLGCSSSSKYCQLVRFAPSPGEFCGPRFWRFSSTILLLLLLGPQGFHNGVRFLDLGALYLRL